MPDGSGPDIGLRHLTDLQCRLEPDIHALLLQHVRQRHAVHGRSQHPHVVGTGTLNVTLAVLHAPPEVAAADDNADLHAHVHALLDDVRHLTQHLKVQAEVLLARQCLAADLQQHPFILRFVHCSSSVCDTWEYFTLFFPVCIEGKAKFFPSSLPALHFPAEDGTISPKRNS